MLLISGLLAIASLATQILFAHAQFPPKPEGVTILDSKFGDGVYISYKEVWSP
jgi:hypothetical protein